MMSTSFLATVIVALKLLMGVQIHGHSVTSSDTSKLSLKTRTSMMKCWRASSHLFEIAWKLEKGGKRNSCSAGIADTATAPATRKTSLLRHAVSHHSRDSGQRRPP